MSTQSLPITGVPVALNTLYVYAVSPNNGRASGTKFFLRYEKRPYNVWQQCLVTSLRDGYVMLAHIPAQYPVTYRRLGHLQSGNCPFVAHKISLLNTSPSNSKTNLQIQYVKSFRATGSILHKRQEAENRFAPQLYSTTAVHKFRESRQSSELRSSLP